MELPQDFIEQMKQELGEEYPVFLASYEGQAWRGVRLNRTKAGNRFFSQDNGTDQAVDEKKNSSPNVGKVTVSGLSVPWCERGRCLSSEEAERLLLGKHPLHFAGAYYIQEPSAMLPAELLDARPGERVLDLCAAPGGKSTQLIDAMEDSGLLVSNDISASRGKAVVKNLERFGVRRILVTAEEPERLAEMFPAFFDKVLVDAPCSGEGMFRREPSMRQEWQEKGPDFYQPLQREILTQAVKMLRPGGRLVYSTCTFNRREDEENAAWLENTVPGLQLLKEEKIWPHRCRGEGQYAALFELVSDPAPAFSLSRRVPSAQRVLPARNFCLKKNEAVQAFFALTRECAWQTENWYEREGQLYELPMDISAWRKLRFLRTGLLLGEIKKGRFEPSQALAMTLKKGQFANTVDFMLEDERIIRYLKGETIETSGAHRQGGDGWCLVLCGGLPLGWAKRTGDTLKNKYAPGLRLQ